MPRDRRPVWAELLGTLDEKFVANAVVFEHATPCAGLLLRGEPLRTETGALDRELVLRALAHGLARAPELRRRLRPAPFGLTTPAWVPDDDIDLEAHVRFHVGVVATDGPELPVLLAGRLNPPLDPRRPLWNTVVAELDDGRVAIAWRIQHAVGDGLYGMRLLDALTEADDAGAAGDAGVAGGAGAAGDAAADGPGSRAAAPSTSGASTSGASTSGASTTGTSATGTSATGTSRSTPTVPPLEPGPHRPPRSGAELLRVAWLAWWRRQEGPRGAWHEYWRKPFLRRLRRWGGRLVRPVRNHVLVVRGLTESLVPQRRYAFATHDLPPVARRARELGGSVHDLTVALALVALDQVLPDPAGPRLGVPISRRAARGDRRNHVRMTVVGIPPGTTLAEAVPLVHAAVATAVEAIEPSPSRVAEPGEPSRPAATILTTAGLAHASPAPTIPALGPTKSATNSPTLSPGHSAPGSPAPGQPGSASPTRDAPPHPAAPHPAAPHPAPDAPTRRRGYASFVPWRPRARSLGPALVGSAVLWPVLDPRDDLAVFGSSYADTFSLAVVGSRHVDVDAVQRAFAELVLGTADDVVAAVALPAPPGAGPGVRHDPGDQPGRRPDRQPHHQGGGTP
ncbi:hypothetical protein ET495_12890 [Xylanimonas allomyrinae]|uniref:O-acyltransferase WSD1-like N-terminal domain-containing protein n=1 Tax=Xylanimonas allomyrinae TaxID=2509459 RepID=A0A4P6ENB2_9MICO|nr:wax ester/triacylglycerol synthase domain-containing protein [Xylanimonas allomyrinae]QAY63975.1 hypothetical protein ET495_12890 [Xylanimonas allomyrinae]